MKKITAALIILSAMVPALAYASTDVTLSPSRTTATVGQSFTVAVVLAPNETVYTSKVALSYSNDVIRYSSFTQSAGWLSLQQSGYDSDVSLSAPGTLVKTGGYPKGISSGTRFGVFTFRATKVGTATISADSGTMILNADGKNVFSGAKNTITITIVPAPIAAAAATTSDEVATSTATTSPLVAAAGQAGGMSIWIWILIILIILALIAIYIWRRNRSKDQQI